MRDGLSCVHETERIAALSEAEAKHDEKLNDDIYSDYENKKNKQKFCKVEKKIYIFCCASAASPPFSRGSMPIGLKWEIKSPTLVSGVVTHWVKCSRKLVEILQMMVSFHGHDLSKLSYHHTLRQMRRAQMECSTMLWSFHRRLLACRAILSRMQWRKMWLAYFRYIFDGRLD